MIKDRQTTRDNNSGDGAKAILLNLISVTYKIFYPLNGIPGGNRPALGPRNLGPFSKYLQVPPKF